MKIIALTGVPVTVIAMSPVGDDEMLVGTKYNGLIRLKHSLGIWKVKQIPYPDNCIYDILWSRGDHKEILVASISGVHRSIDGGKTFRWCSSGLEGKKVQFLRTLPEDPSTYYAITNQNMPYRYMPKQDRWVWLKELHDFYFYRSGSSQDSTSIFCHAKPGSGIRLMTLHHIGTSWATNWQALYIGKEVSYVGTFCCGLFRMYNKGVQWFFEKAGFENTTILSLMVDPTDENRLYVSTADGLYYSSNRGEDFRKIEGI